MVLNDENEYIRYKDEHNHPEQEKEIATFLIKYKIGNEIKNSSNPFEIKTKVIFIEKAREIGFICPEYKSIQSQITRKINKYSR